MSVNKPVPREAEEVDFKPAIAEYEEVLRSRLWYALGVYPVGMWVVFLLLLLGISV